MITYFQNLIKYNGNPSSKRFVGIIASLALIVYMFIIPSDAANNSVLILALGAMGISGFEKFIPTKEAKKDE